MDKTVYCPFCGTKMVETTHYGFKTNVEITDEMIDQHNSGELEPIFYQMVCEECGGASPEFDNEGEAPAFMLGYNERLEKDVVREAHEE